MLRAIELCRNFSCMILVVRGHAWNVSAQSFHVGRSYQLISLDPAEVFSFRFIVEMWCVYLKDRCSNYLTYGLQA